MYKSFFGLSRHPFELTPDPSFLFATERHNEALATLYYGVRRHKGFVVVTGEAGTGKTLLLRCLLRQLIESKDVASAYVFNSLFGPIEFLQYVLADFGLSTSGKNKAELLLDLNHYLLSRAEKQQTTVLVVDEAHLLASEVLEEIRLLTNLETAYDKLLQVLLVGQPELDGKLDSIDLRQLKQRIALRARLEALDQSETKRYLEARLHVAGAGITVDQIFSEQSVAEIYRHTRGIPRLINTICDNALITAYARRVRSIDANIILDVARDLRLDSGLLGNGDIDCQAAAEVKQATHGIYSV